MVFVLLYIGDEPSSLLKASGRGRDKLGRCRSAAIPPSELSREDAGQMWQADKMWQHMRT